MYQEGVLLGLKGEHTDLCFYLYLYPNKLLVTKACLHGTRPSPT